MSINLLPEEMVKKVKEPSQEQKPKEETVKIEMTRPSLIKQDSQTVAPKTVTEKAPSPPPTGEPAKAEIKTESKKNIFGFLSKFKELSQKIRQSFSKAGKKTEEKKEITSDKMEVNKIEEKKDISRKSAQKLSPPSGLGVSLMPREMVIPKRMVRERVLILIAVILIIIFIVTLSWLWLKWRVEIAQEKVDQLKTEILTLETQIQEYSNIIKQARNLEAKASRVDNLFRNHVYWTKFFKFLEDFTATDIYFGDFSAQPSNQIVLRAVGRTLFSTAKQLVAFSSAPEFVKEADISNISGGVGGVTFQITLNLVERVFNK